MRGRRKTLAASAHLGIACSQEASLTMRALALFFALAAGMAWAQQPAPRAAERINVARPVDLSGLSLFGPVYDSTRSGIPGSIIPTGMCETDLPAVQLKTPTGVSRFTLASQTPCYLHTPRGLSAKNWR